MIGGWNTWHVAQMKKKLRLVRKHQLLRWLTLSYFLLLFVLVYLLKYEGDTPSDRVHKQSPLTEGGRTHRQAISRRNGNGSKMIEVTNDGKIEAPVHVGNYYEDFDDRIGPFHEDEMAYISHEHLENVGEAHNATSRIRKTGKNRIPTLVAPEKPIPHNFLKNIQNTVMGLDAAKQVPQTDAVPTWQNNDVVFGDEPPGDYQQSFVINSRPEPQTQDLNQFEPINNVQPAVLSRNERFIPARESQRVMETSDFVQPYQGQAGWNQFIPAHGIMDISHFDQPYQPIQAPGSQGVNTVQRETVIGNDGLNQAYMNQRTAQGKFDAHPGYQGVNYHHAYQVPAMRRSYSEFQTPNNFHEPANPQAIQPAHKPMSDSSHRMDRNKNDDSAGELDAEDTDGDAGLSPLLPGPGRGDRIRQQLKHRLPPTELGSSSKLILLYHGWQDSVASGSDQFEQDRCVVHQCEITQDRDRLAGADVVLYREIIPPLDPGEKKPGQLSVLHLQESPSTAHISSGLFPDLTASFRSDSDIVTPYAKWVSFNDQVLQQEQNVNYAAGKSKMAVMFVSNCQATNNRLQYAQDLAKHIDVDIFGWCGIQSCARGDQDCLNEVVKKYKFFLAFENSNCRDHITEHFFRNALQNSILPVVMGAHPEDYKRVAPANSFIHVEDFDSPQQLAHHLFSLAADDAAYNRHFQWRGTGRLVQNTLFFCRLCAMVHEAERWRGRRSRRDAGHWWNGPRTCTDDRWTSALGRTQQTMLESPDTDYPPPGLVYQLPGQGYMLPGHDYQLPGLDYRPPAQGYRHHGRYPPPGHDYQLPGLDYQPPAQGYQPHGHDYQPPGQGYMLPGQGYMLPGHQPPEQGYQLPGHQPPAQGYQPHGQDYQPHEQDYQSHRQDQPPEQGYQLPGHDHQPPAQGYQPHGQDYQSHRQGQPTGQDYQPHGQDYHPYGQDYQPPKQDYQPHGQYYQPHGQDYQLPGHDHQTSDQVYRPPDHDEY